MPGTAQLNTARLVLRRHVMDDAKVLYENFGQDEAMFEYSGWNPYATLENAVETVARYICSYDNPRCYAWAIENGNRLVGTIGAYDYDPENSTIEIGMSIEKASWGKGFATESIAAVLHYLVDEEMISTVVAWCASDNVGSQRALEKAGMLRVLIEKDALHIGDATFDKLYYKYRTHR